MPSHLPACGKPDTVEPILLDPEGVGYLCTEINMGAEGQQQYSSWYIAPNTPDLQ